MKFADAADIEADTKYLLAKYVGTTFS